MFFRGRSISICIRARPISSSTNGLGYHAVAVGNHEFDKGDQTLANFIAGVQFLVLSANVSLKAGATSPLAALKVTGTSTANGKLGDATIVTLPSGKKS